MYIPRKARFWAVSAGHLVNDMFMSMRGVLLAFINSFLWPMSGREIGLAVSLVELTGALSQPFFGWLADKTGGRWIGAGGVLWTVGFMVMAIITASAGGSYWLFVLPMALAGFGSGAFHPVGAMHATGSEPTRAASNAAWFFLLGQLGLGIGPALAGLILNQTHTRTGELLGAAFPAAGLRFIETGTALPVIVLGVLAFPAAFFMARLIPLTGRPAFGGQASAPAAPFRVPALPFALLIVAVALRGVSQISIVSFMPTILQSKGWNPADYGLLVSSFWIASGIAGVLLGNLGDRFDSRRLIALSLLISAPCVYLIAETNGAVIFLLAFIIGAMGGSHSLIVVLAQGLLPGRQGLASGIILGLIFATGALGNFLVGDLIDRFGAVSAFHITAVITLLGAGLWLFLSRAAKRGRPAESPEAAPAKA
jgi:FSR family fosmidomycin resistance protein-like MFS transporter